MTGAYQPGLAHQPGNPFPAVPLATLTQISMDARRPVSMARTDMDGPDALQQGRIGHGMARGGTVQPRVITRLGHAEHACHRGNREAGLVCAHEPEEPDGSVPVSRANQAAAFDRISRSSRSCLFSRRSRIKLVTLGRGKTRGQFHSSAIVPVGLGNPGANGMAGRLKLSGEIVGITPGSNEIHHLAAKLRRIRWVCSGHR
jgi:hypothetical protein